MTTEEKRELIDPRCKVSIARQCALVGLTRSSYYYRRTEPDRQDEGLMRWLDEQYTQTPFYGVPRMTECLRRLGHRVGPKRVRRLLRTMGLEAVYPKPRLSKPAPGHRIYPYLLRSVKIESPDEVWATDITYVRMRRGFVYLTVVMDWWSRFVLSWKLSQTLETDFCLEALEAALARGRPRIFNSDQGAQFTSEAFTGRLERAGHRAVWPAINARKREKQFHHRDTENTEILRFRFSPCSQCLCGESARCSFIIYLRIWRRAFTHDGFPAREPHAFSMGPWQVASG